MLAFITSPEFMMSPRPMYRSKTMSAPTRCLLIDMHAITIGIMSFREVFLCSLWLNRCRSFPADRCVPIDEKKALISSWNSMTSAIVPRFTALSINEPSNDMLNTLETNIHTIMNTIMPMNMFPERDSFIRR